MDATETDLLTRDNAGRVLATEAGTSMTVRRYSGDQPSETDPEKLIPSPLSGRRKLIIMGAGEGGGLIFIGGQDVINTTGFRVGNIRAEGANDSLLLDISDDVDVWWVTGGSVEHPSTIEVA
jgi:hypothetical protein